MARVGGRSALDISQMRGAKAQAMGRLTIDATTLQARAHANPPHNKEVVFIAGRRFARGQRWAGFVSGRFVNIVARASDISTTPQTKPSTENKEGDSKETEENKEEKDSKPTLPGLAAVKVVEQLEEERLAEIEEEKLQKPPEDPDDPELQYAGQTPTKKADSAQQVEEDDEDGPLEIPYGALEMNGLVIPDPTIQIKKSRKYNKVIRAFNTPRERWRGQKYREAVDKFGKQRFQAVSPTIAFTSLMAVTPHRNFDQTVNLNIGLNIDVRMEAVAFRTTTDLPAGSGKDIKIIVFAETKEKVELAKNAGAHLAGGEELVNEVMAGMMDFEKVLATPAMMRSIGKLGRILGPKGMMPNPKTGSITEDLELRLAEYKKGKVDIKVNNRGCIQTTFGKMSMGPENLRQNFFAIADAINKANDGKERSKPGLWKFCKINACMGPSITMDTDSLNNAAKENTQL